MRSNISKTKNSNANILLSKSSNSLHNNKWKSFNSLFNSIKPFAAPWGSFKPINTLIQTTTKNRQKLKVQGLPLIKNKAQTLYFIVTKKIFFLLHNQKNFHVRSLHFIWLFIWNTSNISHAFRQYWVKKFITWQKLHKTVKSTKTFCFNLKIKSSSANTTRSISCRKKKDQWSTCFLTKFKS